MLSLSLMISFGLNSTKTFGAELPQSLKPGAPNAFWCTDKPGAQVVARTFRENKQADEQIKGDAVTVDWAAVGIGAVAGAIITAVVWSISSGH